MNRKETQSSTQFEQWNERKSVSPQKNSINSNITPANTKKKRKQKMEKGSHSSYKKEFIAGSITAVIVFVGGGIAAWTVVMSFINSL